MSTPEIQPSFFVQTAKEFGSEEQKKASLIGSVVRAVIGNTVYALRVLNYHLCFNFMAFSATQKAARLFNAMQKERFNPVYITLASKATLDKLQPMLTSDQISENAATALFTAHCTARSAKTAAKVAALGESIITGKEDLPASMVDEEDGEIASGSNDPVVPVSLSDLGASPRPGRVKRALSRTASSVRKAIKPSEETVRRYRTEIERLNARILELPDEIEAERTASPESVAKRERLVAAKKEYDDAVAQAEENLETTLSAVHRRQKRRVHTPKTGKRKSMPATTVKARAKDYGREGAARAAIVGAERLTRAAYNRALAEFSKTRLCELENELEGSKALVARREEAIRELTTPTTSTPSSSFGSSTMSPTAAARVDDESSASDSE